MSRGYFQRNRIAATAHVPSDTSAQIRLVAAGKADFGFSYETDLLAARAHHIPVQSVMCVMQHPLNTVMALRSSGITRPRQLEGKTVGMAGSPSDIPIVSAMVTHDGGSIDRVRMVNVGYNLLPALLAKRVDAVVGVYWTWEAIQAREKGYPVNVLRVEKWGVPNYCELVLVASEKTVQTRKAYVRDVVQALQEGYAYAEAHPGAAWQALQGKASGLNHTLVVDSLKLLAPVVTDAPTVGYQNGQQWRKYAAWLARNKLIDAPVNANAAFTNQFLRPGVK
jgi:putative hydroxymethylpyrimidine transport system substrate-binding protein